MRRPNAVYLQYKTWSRHEYWLPTTGLRVIDERKLPTNAVKQVPRRIIEVSPTKAYIERVRYRIHEHEYDEMMDMLDQIDERQTAACRVCKALRLEEQQLASSKSHTKEEAAEARSKRRQVSNTSVLAVPRD